MKPLGIRTRLNLLYMLVLVGLFAVLSSVSYHVLRLRIDDSLNAELREMAAGLLGYLRFPGGRPSFDYDARDPNQTYFVESATRYYQVFDLSTGELLDQSREMDLLNVDLRPKEVLTEHMGPFVDIDTGDDRLRLYNEKIRDRDGKSYLLQIGVSLGGRDSALRQFLLILGFLVPAALLLAGAASWWMAGKALQPVRLLTQVAEEIGISDLDRRLPLRGADDELDQLAQTFNGFFSRLQKAIGEMKQFTASISHELRTPLTALRGEAEVLLLDSHPVDEYRRVLASHLEEYDRLTRIMNTLLMLARAETGDIQMNPERLDLAALARSLVEQLDAVGASKGISFSIEGEGPVMAQVDPDWMESIILNLLDNAIKYTPGNGKVVVAVRQKDHEAGVEVRDTGIGIPPEALPHIFEKFYRAEPSRTRRYEGTGLGLALVKMLVQKNHGRIDVESRLGIGSSFRVWFPRA